MWTDRRTLLAIGGISVLLNVFLLGIVLGRFHARDERRPGLMHGAGLISAAHLRAIPVEERHLFARAMAPHRPAIRAARELQRAARMVVETEIATPAYDGTKLTQDFAALRQANEHVGEIVDAALVDALSGLPASTRAALVARVRKPVP